MTRREALEQAIVHALELLDRMDGDPDLELDGGDELDGSDELNMQMPVSYRAA